MRNTQGTKVLASLVALSLVSGCSLVKKEPSDYPLVPQLSEKEVVDYYKQALQFDTIASKNLEIHEVTYETREVTGDKEKKLKGLVEEIENVLYYMTYQSGTDTNLISEDTFHYIKSMLNDKKLTNGTVVSVEEALGYYFVDVEYDVSARLIGDFTEKVNLLGLHGAFKRDYKNNDSVDNTFMKKAVKTLNDYYKENKIEQTASFDQSTGLFKVSGSFGDSIDFSKTTIIDSRVDNKKEEQSNKENNNEQGNSDEIVQNQENTADNEVPENQENSSENGQNANNNSENGNSSENTENSENGNENENNTEDKEEIEKQNNDDIRKSLQQRFPKIDTSEFNKIAGSSIGQSAYMPKLTEVYKIPEPSGEISGIGIYPSGGSGLLKFGYNRTALNGKMTLRYVFKDDVMTPDTTLGVNIYPVNIEITSGINTNTENVKIPDFLMTEFSKLLERADRALCNNDLSALMSGSLYGDKGMAVLNGYESQHVNLLRNMSTIRRVIDRDEANNAYLLEIETIRQEGAKDVDSYGTYRDKSYVVIEQFGDKFVITDQILMTRKMTKEPSINPDSSVTKRLVALNLSGAVSQEAKSTINNLMNDLYKAGTYRLLNGPKEVNGETIEKGMYDCFNDDTALLSSNHKEYLNSGLRETLVKYGVETSSTYTGIVTEWLGGSDNQVEFTTEELIEYKGKNIGHYQQVYYLVSNMHDKWVIDEMHILEEKEVEGNELQTVSNRLNDSKE